MTTQSNKDDDLLKEAKDAYDQDSDHWSDIYIKARQDLKFLSDDPFAQWDEQDYNSRVETGRPALTIDQLGQFVHQVVNDIRMNTPAINVIPDGNDADVDTAEIYKGLIKNIEYKSNASEVYDTAATFSTKSSIGFIRVDHDYCDDDGFDQELLIKRVYNPLACTIDRASVECDGSDAMRAHIKDKISVAEFKRRWPDKDVSCFETKDKSFADAKDADEVTICEYFKIIENGQTISADDDGNISPYDDKAPPKTSPKRKRTVKKRQVMRYLLSGKDVLEQTKFPGKYIPLVPVYGEEAWIDGQRNLFSLIRKSKEAQKMYNYWKSLETELLMKQPQAPVMVGAGQVEDYMEDWKNPSKSMVLRYNTHDVNGNPLPAPQRLDPPTIPTGIVNAARETVDDIKATMGLYNASLGNQSNETSGVAIDARKHEGDVATYHFADNLNRSIAQVGRILVFAAPEIYDTARIIRILGEDDEPKQVGINGAMAPNQVQTIDLAKGKYKVRVITGASFTTKRQEAAQFFTDIVKQQPQLMGVMGDLLFKNMDFTGAQAMADRMKKIIDQEHPGLIESEDGSAPPVDPKLIQAQHMIQQLQAQLQQVGQELKDKQTDQQLKLAEIQAKSQSEQTKHQNDQMKIQTEAQNSQMKTQVESQTKETDNRLKGIDLLLQERALDIQEQQVAGNLAIAEFTAKMDSFMQVMQQIQASLPGSAGIGSSSPDQSATTATATTGETN